MNWNPLKVGKSAKERKLEETQRQIEELSARVKEREKMIVSRVFIRDADLKVMRFEKNRLAADQRELEKLKRQKARLEDSCK